MGPVSNELQKRDIIAKKATFACFCPLALNINSGLDLVPGISPAPPQSLISLAWNGGPLIRLHCQTDNPIK